MGARRYGSDGGDLLPGTFVASLDGLFPPQETVRLRVGGLSVLYTPSHSDAVSVAVLKPVRDGFCVVGTYGFAFGGRRSQLRFRSRLRRKDGVILLRFSTVGEYRGEWVDGERRVSPDEVGVIELGLRGDKLTIERGE